MRKRKTLDSHRTGGFIYSRSLPWRGMKTTRGESGSKKGVDTTLDFHLTKNRTSGLRVKREQSQEKIA